MRLSELSAWLGAEQSLIQMKQPVCVGKNFAEITMPGKRYDATRCSIEGEMRNTNIKIYKAWGGFSSGKLHETKVDFGSGGFGISKNITFAIFKTRREAREKYRDVRRISIVVSNSR